MEDYKTIKQAGSYQLTIKKSDFIGHVARAQTEEEAQDFIQAIKKEHAKATHNCAAYQIGDHNQVQRAFDDGEPQGTAGVPMLEVLKQENLKNIVVVVTRYFGGIKLGAGGLIRSYSQCTSETIQTVGLVIRQVQQELALTIPYELTGPIEYWLQESPYEVLDTTYLENVTYDIGVPIKQLAAVKERLTNLTSGQGQITEKAQVYVDIPLKA